MRQPVRNAARAESSQARVLRIFVRTHKDSPPLGDDESEPAAVPSPVARATGQRGRTTVHAVGPPFRPHPQCAEAVT